MGERDAQRGVSDADAGLAGVDPLDHRDAPRVPLPIAPRCVREGAIMRRGATAERHRLGGRDMRDRADIALPLAQPDEPRAQGLGRLCLQVGVDGEVDGQRLGQEPFGTVRRLQRAPRELRVVGRPLNVDPACGLGRNHRLDFGCARFIWRDEALGDHPLKHPCAAGARPLGIDDGVER